MHKPSNGSSMGDITRNRPVLAVVEEGRVQCVWMCAVESGLVFSLCTPDRVQALGAARQKEWGHILLLLGDSPLHGHCRAAETLKAQSGGQEYVS